MKGLEFFKKGDEPIEGKATGFWRPDTGEKAGIDRIEIKRNIDRLVSETSNHRSQRSLIRYDRFHLLCQFKFLLSSGSNSNLKQSALTQPFGRPSHHRTVGKEFPQIMIPQICVSINLKKMKMGMMRKLKTRLSSKEFVASSQHDLKI